MNNITWAKHKDSANRTYQQAEHRGNTIVVQPIGRDLSTGERILEVRAFAQGPKYEVIAEVSKMPQGREVGETWLMNEAGKSSRIATRQPDPEPEEEYVPPERTPEEEREFHRNWHLTAARAGALEQEGYRRDCLRRMDSASATEKLALQKSAELHLIHVNNIRRDLEGHGDREWTEQHLADVPHTYKTFH